MQKEMLKKKLGRPPMPPFMPESQKRPGLRKRDYTPVSWNKYFQTMQDVLTPAGNTFRMYKCGTDGPVLLFLHGGGFSALSWALLSVRVTALVKCQCVAVDMRGHGDTVTDCDLNLSAEQMSRDIQEFVAALYGQQIPPIILVGHSMGGAIAVHTAVQGFIPTLIGLAVIDVVEGTAMESLNSMQSFLRGRPNTFDSMERAIEWAVRSGQIQNVESAKVSMVGQMKRVESESIKETPRGSISNIIEEEAENEDGVPENPSQGGSTANIVQSSSSTLNDKSSESETSQTHKYTWRINLSATEKFWAGWFQGLSQMFLACPAPKMLILAGHDRLDRDLTIGQMQGKFQMNLLPQCGHAVHEDVPDKVADILANFMLRQKVTEAL